MQLKQIHQIRGSIFLVTGLHIGAGKDNIEIGGMDNPIIKNPYSTAPYIPGSSLKGKMRSQLELVYFSDESSVKYGNPCDNPETSVCKVFGMPISKSNEEARAKVGATRIVVRDAVLSKKWLEKFVTGEVTMEEKNENTIDRVKGVATNPRPMERVPAGVSFDFSFSLKEMGDDDLAENLNLIWKGMRLIELDGLGGSISRGSGQVEFQDVLLNGKPTDFREIPLWE